MINFNKLIKSKKSIGVILISCVVAGGLYWNYNKSKSTSNQIQTDTVKKGNIVSSITVSGTIDQSNTTKISTQLSGSIEMLNIKDGDTVTKGQIIAKISPDIEGQQQQTSSWNNYLLAKKNYESAKSSLYSLQSTLFSANQKFINDAVARGLTTDDPTYIQQNADWLAAESSYKNQQLAISQALSAFNNAQISYQQSSINITAPVSGKVIALNVTKGSQVQGGSSSIETIAIIQSEGNPIAKLDMSEADIVNINNGQKAILTLDSISDKTFTGSVVSINRVGESSSGVTAYPILIKLDSSSNQIMPNMAISAKIILESKQDVLTVPSSSVTISNGESVVKVKQNGQILEKVVTTGIESDSEIEIISGLTQGEIIITSSISNTSTSNRTQNNSFSTFGGIGGGVPRDAIRIPR